MINRMEPALKEMYNKVDKDLIGKVNFDEIVKYIDDVKDTQHYRDMYNMVHHDKDGYIEYDQFNDYYDEIKYGDDNKYNQYDYHNDKREEIYDENHYGM